jgi:hypothetical protein
MFRLKFTFRPPALPGFAKLNRAVYVQGVLGRLNAEWSVVTLANGDLVAVAQYELDPKSELSIHESLMLEAKEVAFGLPLVAIAVSRVASPLAEKETPFLIGAVDRRGNWRLRKIQSPIWQRLYAQRARG